MRPTETVELGDEAGADEDEAGVDVWDSVDDGRTDVDEGELDPMQVLSFEEPTISTGELPPERPWESYMMNTMEVPLAAFEIQE
jgi:hypothetical protein